jgi:hypothetical protein
MLVIACTSLSLHHKLHCSIQYYHLCLFQQCLRNLQTLAKCTCISGHSMLPFTCILHGKIREKIPISESCQPDGGISHLECGNILPHIVRGEGGRGSGGLSWKIQPCVEDFFFVYLLPMLCRSEKGQRYYSYRSDP